MRFRLQRLLCVLAVSVFSLAAESAVLKYRVEGVGKEARTNIQAFLGDNPRDKRTADRFLVTAEERAGDALEALGIYDYDIDVAVDREQRPWDVRLSVRAGDPLSYSVVRIDLEGEGADDEQLLALLANAAPAVGDRLHHGRYEDFKAQLTQLARQRGFFSGEFIDRRVTVDAAAQAVELTWRFETGSRARLGPVNVDESLLSPDLLQRLLPFAAGDLYEQRLLLELRQRLLRLGYFSSVIVVPDFAALDGDRVPVTVDLVPAPAHSYELGLGYSTDTRQRVSLLWRSPRLNRFGHSQESSLRWSPVNPAARLTYTIPLDDPANELLQLSARLEDNEYGDLQSMQRELGVRRERTRKLRVQSLSLRGLDEEWGVFNDDFDAAFVLAGASLSRRVRQGNAVDPSGGRSEFYSVEGGTRSLGSDEDLLRVYGSVTGLHRLGERWRLVSRGEAGYLWSSSRRPDQLPPSLAFFAGGDNSIRGYGYQSLGREVTLPALTGGIEQRLVVGGTRLLTGSLELQRYLRDSWRVALFADAGDAFDSGDFDASVGLGFGVHYMSPVGAIRFELAKPLTNSGESWRFHINIGAEF